LLFFCQFLFQADVLCAFYGQLHGVTLCHQDLHHTVGLLKANLYFFKLLKLITAFALNLFDEMLVVPPVDPRRYAQQIVLPPSLLKELPRTP
jgi:hypothetical protein